MLLRPLSLASLTSANRSSTRWRPARTIQPPMPSLSACCRKCNGCIPPASIRASISTGRLRSPTSTPRSSSSRGLGNARKMDERALAFAQKYSKRLSVLDATDFGLEAVAGEVAEYLTPIMFNLVLRLYAVELGDKRGHPLTVRRYMWRMEY